MDEQEKTIAKRITLAVTGLIMLAVGFTLKPFSIIQAGHRGVVLRLGEMTRVMPEGINWKTPWVEKVAKIDIRIQKEEVLAAAASKDLQTVNAVIALNFHLEALRVGDLYRAVGGKEYKAVIIDPAIQESVKAVTAKFTAEELITKRQLVKDEIKASLAERLAKEFIIVDEVSIVTFDFSPAFNAAIEMKVTAEQQALAAKNKLEQVKYEKEQRITQAQGEAEAIRIQAQAITQQGGDDYVQLQAIKQWKGEVPTYMMGNSVPFINLK